MSTDIGTEAPAFSLPDTDGNEHSPGGARATLVVFTCNHCPYALAWHDRIAAVAEDYPDVKVLAVSSNDAERYPRDSFEARMTPPRAACRSRTSTMAASRPTTASSRCRATGIASTGPTSC